VEGADALGLIAEVGIAIAGFAGVIVTLRAPGGAMETYAAVRIGALFGWSPTAVLADRRQLFLPVDAIYPCRSGFPSSSSLLQATEGHQR
jgi:hypothetical protein